MLPLKHKHRPRAYPNIPIGTYKNGHRKNMESSLPKW